MSGAPSEGRSFGRAMLWISVLLVPGCLLLAWAVLVLGGGIDDMVAEEKQERLRDLELAAAAVRTTLESEPPASAIRIRLDESGRPIAPFVMAPTETSAPDVGVVAATILEHSFAGRHQRAVEFYQHAITRGSTLPPEARLAAARSFAALENQAAGAGVLRRGITDHAGAWIGALPASLAYALLLTELAPDSRDDLRQAILDGTQRLPLTALDAIVQRLQNERILSDDEALDVLTAARIVVPADDPAFVAGPRGTVISRSGQSLRMIPRRTVDAAVRDQSNSRIDVERAQTSDRDANARSSSLEVAWSDSPLRATAKAPPRSEQLRLLARVLAWAALAAFVIGNLLLVRMVRRETALARMRSNFIDLVSHELRTPLTALTVKAEMLAHGHVPPKKVERYQQDLHSAARRLGDLVQRILDFARLEKSGGIEAQRIEGRQLVASAVRATRAGTDLQGRRFRVQAPRHLPAVDADSELISRAVRNLVDNAVRYGADGSPIELRVHAERNGLTLSVLDEGPGLEDVDPKTLFEPFRRGSKGSGSGLGLAIVEQAARAHDGHAQASNRPDGRGAAFSLWIPGAPA